MSSNFQYNGLIKPAIIASFMPLLMIFNCDFDCAFGSSSRQVRINKAEIRMGNNTFGSMAVKNENKTPELIIAVDRISADITFDFAVPKTIGSVRAFIFMSPLMSSMSFIISLAKFNKNANPARPNESKSIKLSPSMGNGLGI